MVNACDTKYQYNAMPQPFKHLSTRGEKQEEQEVWKGAHSTLATRDTSHHPRPPPVAKMAAISVNASSQLGALGRPKPGSQVGGIARRSLSASRPQPSALSMGQLRPYLTNSGTPNRVAGRYPVRGSIVASASLSDFLPIALFFTPSIIAVIYAYIIGKGNLTDGLSRLLTQVSQGYFQPNVGGKNIPVATGELSDLAGDEPLFKALYNW